MAKLYWQLRITIHTYVVLQSHSVIYLVLKSNVNLKSTSTDAGHENTEVRNHDKKPLAETFFHTMCCDFIEHCLEQKSYFRTCN